MNDVIHAQFKKTLTIQLVLLLASFTVALSWNQVFAENQPDDQHVVKKIPLGQSDNHKNEVNRLAEVPIEESDQFTKGICPTGDNFIDNLTLISAINKRDSVKDYVPPNLVEITNLVKTKGDRKICLEETTAINLKKMFDDAKLDKLNIIVTSGYRSPQVQLYLFNNAISKSGYRGTLRVAPPFHSEHHLNAVDLTSLRIKGQSASSTFGQTPEGKWMRANAYKYGFVQSYPKGKESVTGYVAEDWHWRYIGKENALLVKNTGMTFHELVTGSLTKPISARTFTQMMIDAKKKQNETEIAG